jgi:hypothetical protein
MKNTLALSAAAVALLTTPLPAQAAYVVDLTQVVDKSQPLGFDVVATGSGTIDLTDLTFGDPASSSAFAAIIPSFGAIFTGPPGGVPVADQYDGATGPRSFGGAGGAFASSGSGDIVGIESPFGSPVIGVPAGYTSGSHLSDTSTYDNATFASLGATPGTYKYTWGSGANADSFTVQIGIPEPSTWALMALGFGLLGGAGYWTRRRSVAIAA